MHSYSSIYFYIDFFSFSFLTLYALLRINNETGGAFLQILNGNNLSKQTRHVVPLSEEKG